MSNPEFSIVNLFSKSLRLALTAPVRVDGKELHEHAIALTGTWTKADRTFSITRDDLDDMVDNFQQRKNKQVVVDFEHASEMPEVARGGPVPAAGWIHSLYLRQDTLYALIEWTGPAKRLIQAGQYRFFSPAIDWAAKDKETGEVQGATLTSGALTNHPFLEELPAIALTDQSKVESQESRVKPSTLDSGLSTSTKGGKMKYKLMKKLAGRRTLVGDDGAELGEFTLDDLELDEEEFEDLAAKFNSPQSVTEALGMTEVQIGQARRALAFSECLSNGRIDLDKAAELADTDRIGMKDFRQIQKAQELVERAIQEGKFAPADRDYISRVALADVGRFEEWTKKKPKVVPLGPPQGLPGTSDSRLGGTPDSELAMRLSQLMSEKNLDRRTALEELTRQDPELVRRYRQGQGRIQ